MNAGIQHFTNYLREQESLVDKVCDDIAMREIGLYATMPRPRLQEQVSNHLQAFQESLAQSNAAPIQGVARAIAYQHAIDLAAADDVMCFSDVLRDTLWQAMARLYVAGDWDMDVVEQVERLLHEQRKAVSAGYDQALREAQERVDRRERDFDMQSRIIQELSTPIVPIYEGVLVLPLVGAVDSRRATRIMEEALEQIVTYQADMLIIDITGVSVIDTAVANYFIQMTHAVTLLGAQVVMVGMSAEVAQTIVQLGVDLSDITTLADLRNGIAYALAQQGFEIAPIPQEQPLSDEPHLIAG
jgi:rsbT co-antagonist protein RsbR